MDDLLQSAMKLKQAEVDRQRPMFRAAPMYKQGTLFHEAAVTEIRNLGLNDRISAAERFIKEGGDHMRQQSSDRQQALRSALKCYEHAYGLFVWIEGRTESWRSRGIRDEDLTFRNVLTDPALTPEATKQAIECLTTVLCNYSLCAAEQGLVEAAEAALREAHSASPQHLRAAYLLARHLHRKSTSTSRELEEAIAVLEKALTTAEASDSRTRDAETFLTALRAELRKVSEVHKRMTARPNHLSSVPDAPSEDTPPPGGALCPPPTGGTTTDNGAALKGGWFEQAEQCRVVIRRLRDSGQEKEAELLDIQLREAAAEKLFVEFVRPRNAFHVGYGGAELDAFCAMLQIDTEDPVVKLKLRSLSDRHFYEQLPLQWMTPEEVELELFALGAISTTEIADEGERIRRSSTSSADSSLVTTNSAASKEKSLRELLRKVWAEKRK